MRLFNPKPESSVLVVGDVILDRYVHGSTNRISPEAPVPVVRVDETEDRPGGAANVALNIQQLGSSVILIGVTGADSAADKLFEYLTGLDIQCQFSRQADFPTITKLRVLSQHQQLLRLDYESDSCQLDVEPIVRLYKKNIVSADVIILSDYAKGSLKDIETFIQIANENNKFTLIDPKGDDFYRYKNAGLLTPNINEFEGIVGPCADQATLSERGHNLREELGLKALLITQGERGMTLLEEKQSTLHLRAEALEVFDVTGAGDTVIATLATAKASNYDLKEAMYFANKAAALAVAKLGTTSISYVTLNESLAPSHSNKQVSLEQLLETVDLAKNNNELLIMTNGCFDILHAGHVFYLDAAKKIGDILIVAVNDDDSVRELKGSNRPINTLAKRLDVLSALEAVDYVISFSESTPENLIKQIKPDVLVKGNDYEIEDIAGADFILENGGRVETISLKKGCSTTELINNIKLEIP